MDADTERRSDDRLGRTRRALAALDLVEEGAATPPRRARRRRLTRVALLAAAAAAAFHFSIHPEDGTYWRRIGREAHRLLSELRTLTQIEPPAAPSPSRRRRHPPSPRRPPLAGVKPGTHAEGPAEGSIGLPVEATPVGTPPTSEESDQAGVAAAGPPLGESSPSEPTA